MQGFTPASSLVVRLGQLYVLIKLVSCEMLVTDSKYLTELFFVLPEGYITAIGYYQNTCLTLLILYCTSLILYEIPKCESLYIYIYVWP